MRPVDGAGTARAAAGAGPWLIAIAASAGGIRAIGMILRSLPKDLSAAVVVVQHRAPGRDTLLFKILRGSSALPVVDAAEGLEIQPATVYVAHADSHLTIAPDRTFQYHDGSRICFVRSSANPLFESAARVFDGHLIAVVLTGGGHDATDGVQSVKAHDGHVIAQNLETSQHWSMPSSAIQSGAVDYVLPLDAIGPALTDIVKGRPVSIPSPQ